MLLNHTDQYHEPAWIEEDSSRHNVFLILTDFLRNCTNPTEAENLLTATVKALLACCSHEPSVEQYMLESSILYAILLTLVKQTNAAAKQHDHLVRIVVKLRHIELPLSVVQGMDGQSMYRDMNRDLSMLISVFSGFEQDAPLHPPLEDRLSYGHHRKQMPWWGQARLTPVEWTSLNAFIARLHAAEPDVHKLDLRGLFAMIEALEQRLLASELNDVLPAAAAWAVYAGAQLKGNNIPYAGYDDDGGTKRLPWSKGELWTGRHAFNDERWRFWMRRFQKIAESDEVSAGVKLASTEAFEAMSRVL